MFSFLLIYEDEIILHLKPTLSDAPLNSQEPHDVVGPGCLTVKEIILTKKNICFILNLSSQRQHMGQDRWEAQKYVSQHYQQ